MANLNMIGRDSYLIKALADRDVVVQASFQVSRVDRKTKYTNIAIQKITVIINDIEYHMDHAWLQQKDYPSYFRSMAKEGEWYDVDLKFYAYRDKTDKTANGVTMHGMDILDVWELTDEEVIADFEETFKQATNITFNNNFK